MAAAPLYSIPTANRPPHGSLVSLILFCGLFNLGIILTNLLQLICFPLSLFPATQPHWQRILDGTKGSFGQLCVLITEQFAPTQYVITGGEGMGVTKDWVEKDKSGRVVGIKLPEKGVWVANHQTLADWIYIWAFTYLTSHSSSIIITLKSSIRAIPIIGWACQLFNFVFLSRKWETDKKPFGEHLDKIAERAKDGRSGTDKLAVLIFPEGTLVTGNTKPVSEKYAEKIGVKPYSHVLLPRTTGLHFTLSTLLPSLPSLSLIDLTIGYPGPNASISQWPEDYYNLSLWMKGVPPPQLHFFVRQWKVGEIPGLNADGDEKEREKFDEWIRDRWREKDELMEYFVDHGVFPSSLPPSPPSTFQKSDAVTWPVALRSFPENFQAFSYFIPLIVLWFAVPWIWKALWLAGGLGVRLLGKSKGGGEKKACGCGKMGGAKVEL